LFLKLFLSAIILTAAVDTCLKRARQRLRRGSGPDPSPEPLELRDCYRFTY